MGCEEDSPRLRATGSLRWAGPSPRSCKAPEAQAVERTGSGLPSPDGGLESRRFPPRHVAGRVAVVRKMKKALSYLRVTVGTDPEQLQKGRRQVHPESHIRFIGTKWFFVSKTTVLYLTQCSDDKSGAVRSRTPHSGPCPCSFMRSPCWFQQPEASQGPTSWVICFPRMLSPSRILQAATLIAHVSMDSLNLLLDPGISCSQQAVPWGTLQSLAAGRWAVVIHNRFICSSSARTCGRDLQESPGSRLGSPFVVSQGYLSVFTATPPPSSGPPLSWWDHSPAAGNGSSPWVVGGRERKAQRLQEGNDSLSTVRATLLDKAQAP